MMKSVFSGCLALLALAMPARADLVVTEVMCKSSHSDTTRNGDWWELTNTGTTAVALTNYSWDDDPPVAGTVKCTSGVSVLPGESIVILDENDATNFKSAWNLTGINPVTGAAYKVLVRADFAAPATGFPGFSDTGGDGVYMFNAANAQVAGRTYTGVTPAGVARAWFTNGTPVPGELSVAGQLGAYTSTDTAPDTGSPCKAVAVPANSPPYFSTPAAAFAVVGQDLATSPFRVRALDNDAGQTLSYSTLSKPAWLNLLADGTGALKFGGTASATVGTYTFAARATDNFSPTPAATDRTHTLTLVPATSPVILNEFNAVDNGNIAKFLNGGTAVSDLDGGTAADEHFGRIAGNGGDWFEMVVVGNGTAGTVDMRGWKMVISQAPAGVPSVSSTLVLSQDAYWAAVPTGTILTFIEHNTSQGGRDTGINLRNLRASTGESWTNIWLGDTTYLTYTDAATNGYTVVGGVASGLGLDELDTRVTVQNAAGTVVAGPFGEGVAWEISINDTEVFALNGDPSPALSPLAVGGNGVPGYQDKSTRSSFGLPNKWSIADTQDFFEFVSPPTPYHLWSAGLGLSTRKPAADPDGDGRNNRAEYAFGGNPAAADGPPAQGIVRSGGNVVWTYARRSGDTSLSFIHQHSTDLTTWTTLVPTSVSVAAHPTLTGFDRVTVTVAAPPGAPGFFRVALP